ncbi:MAG: dienelactone hydrolase family protein [Gammaproteobacteria bacterium]
MADPTADSVAVHAMRIRTATVELCADVAVPAHARGLVIFAHGSGSGRHSTRNRYVAEVLHERHLATVLADLLTEEEEVVDRATRHLRFDIPLLAGRLSAIGDWSREQPELRNLDCGYFGASTGAAAALIAAATQQFPIRAVVSRGGRPDLAGDYLKKVKAPVLLIVGGHDADVLRLNERALQSLNADSRLDVIPRASHLFEEPGTLEAAAQLAADWFDRHLG